MTIFLILNFLICITFSVLFLSFFLYLIVRHVIISFPANNIIELESIYFVACFQFIIISNDKNQMLSTFIIYRNIYYFLNMKYFRLVQWANHSKR